jgi:protoheme IX farnesyltransferase
MSGLLYLSGALALGMGFIWHAWRLYSSEGDTHTMKTFGYSIFYLSALFVFLLADHYLRELIHGLFLA